GHTVWIIQDELLRNVEFTTRLKTDDIPDNPHQNISFVVMHYEVAADGSRGMSFKAALGGDAGINFRGNDTFTDILLPKTAPPKSELLKAILRRKVEAILHL
nr:hypothetical protein [Ardenticatenales bacterium]